MVVVVPPYHIPRPPPSISIICSHKHSPCSRSRASFIRFLTHTPALPTTASWYHHHACFPTNVILQILLCLTHVTMKHAENSGLASADPIVAITTTSPPEAPSFWPPYTSLPRGFPSHYLLVGTEALVWRSMGAVLGSDKTSHVTPTLALTKLESLAKQVALRQALRRIGLGWVATNTTPFRILAGKLYNRAVDQLK